jgi:hypothetical protein
MAIRCNCCKRDFSPNTRPFVGKIVYGWLAEFTDKLITEGRPVALTFCKDCIDSGKVEISAWSSFAMPLHVKSNGSGFIIDFMKYDQAPVKSAACEADRARAAAPAPETKDNPDGHHRLDEVPARDPLPPAAATVPPAPPQPEPQQKGAASVPAGVCSKCTKEITQSEFDRSNYVHGVPLCKECEAVETARVTEIMRGNEAAGRPLTEGLGDSIGAVAFCVECGGLVNEKDRKASRLFFNKSLCKTCLGKAMANPGAKK